MPAQFNVSAADAHAVAQLQDQFNLPRFAAAVLVARGMDTIEAAERFLAPSLERDWLDPYVIPGMKEVVDAVAEAIRARKRIVVFGDFDADGITATAVLTRGLRALGSNATPFIPRRFEEGYGITPAACERLKTLAPDLVVTVDCGIACKHEVAALVADGIQVVVTDHHEPVDLVPENVPVVDPKTDSACPSGILAGCGVALKLVQALGARFGFPHLWRSYTDLATLGTVGDLMPLRGENRALVQDGLDAMNTAPRPCLAALLGQTGAQGADKKVTSVNLGFTLIPRLNAAGRMGDAQAALDLLMTDDFDTACTLARALDGINDERRTIEAELSEEARAKAAATYQGQRALVVAGEGWHEGVKGIVASRLVHAYGVPCILFTIVDGEARGSGRTVGAVNLLKAVESLDDLLIRFGGHEAAVGVTLPADKLDEFSERLCAYMDKLPDDEFHPRIEVDACVELSELSLENVGALDRLAPFGQENRVPCLLARNVTLTNSRAVGAGKNHFACTLFDGRARVSAIMFHASDIDSLMRTDTVVNAAFEVQIDEWRGNRTVKAMLKSLAPVQMCGALEACLNPANTQFVAGLYATSDAELCADAPVRVQDVDAYEAQRAKNRAEWEQRAHAESEELEAAVIARLIGQAPIHDSQRRVLDLLDAGRSVLAVMATGRGKSLVFQVHAAVSALRDHAASVFVYPLRALISDQAFHLTQALSPFGIGVSVLTGESTPAERARIFADLAAGSCDIVLTTPEFLECHAGRFAEGGRVAFAVVDEAHHIGLSRAGHRPAYSTIGEAIARMGAVRVLALTATANEEVARSIASALPLDEFVYDEAQRANLIVHDRRGLKARDAYLANLVGSGEKTVVYVHSREQSVAVARALRKRVPQIALLIGFYNAGLSREERTRVEQLFRTGSLSVLVTTSAFGEGVNIPDIRHVVLYHLPFNEIEFNQMSGRAGRDGALAGVHLLYARDDARANERILGDMAPDRAVMECVYRTLRVRQKREAQGFFSTTPERVSAEASGAGVEVSPAAAACALSVFRELGLIEMHVEHVVGEQTRLVRVASDPARVDLTDSVRYREGEGDKAVFGAFRQWALGEDAAQLQQRVSRPILPACAIGTGAQASEGKD